MPNAEAMLDSTTNILRYGQAQEPRLMKEVAQKRYGRTGKANAFWPLSPQPRGARGWVRAFGAHGLKKRISDPSKLANWGTAAQYQLIHSGVLLLSTAVAPRNKVAAGLFTAGIAMFSGSLYLLVLDPQRFKAMGPVTPIGGLCLIGGWAALAFGSRGRIVAS
ncbi:UPF0382 membrane protein [Sphaceloma murrayae]|uniref:UPF0382 membrane protein n=1 Tax=Sphaceloma murrayae TaxID=2082308 RepID=A0A2K1QZF8_9PEZI|nr:UPF0382 membrane protein [Sphaceloma murrayae]